MNRYEKAIKLSEKDFKQIIGVKKATFHAMVKYCELHMQKSTNVEVGIRNGSVAKIKKDKNNFNLC